MTPSRSSRTPEQSYLFRIIRCEPTYSVMIRNFPRQPAAMEEFAHHQFITECLFPKKHAGRETTLLFLGRREMSDGFGKSAAAVGHLKMRGKTAEFLGTLPMDVIQSVTITTLLGGYRFIYLHGTPLQRGEAEINSIAFEHNYSVSELER